MATYTTYDGAGAQNAEDVDNRMWYDISPEETPVLTLARQGVAKATLHEWLEIAKRAPKSNAQVEGAAAPAATGHTPDRPNNYTQIFEEVAQVSDTQNTVDVYGISEQMAKEIALKTVELKTDVETAIVGAPGGTRQAATAGDAANPRILGCLQSLLSDDVREDLAGGGSLTEAAVLACHQKVRTKGGGKDLWLVHSIEAGIDIANFVTLAGSDTGRRRDIGNTRELVNTLEVLVTPYGRLACVMDDFIDRESALLMDDEYVEINYLRPFYTKPLSEDGFFQKRGLTTELTISALNQFATGYVDEIYTNIP